MKEQSKMVSYVSKEIGISILLPQEWITQVVSQGQVRFFGLQESGFEQYFEEYRSTMSYLLAEPEDKTTDWFESLIANSASQMKHDYNEYKLIFEEYHEISGCNAYIRQYEWLDKYTNLQFSQLQSLIHKDSNSFYLVNAGTLKPLENKYMPIFKSILHSTRIITV